MKIHGADEAYGLLDETKRLEFEGLIKKHFANKSVKIDFDAIDGSLRLLIDNQDCVSAQEGGIFDNYSNSNLFDYSMIDLAYDVNMFFANIFGGDYIEGSMDEIDKFIERHSDKENDSIYDSHTREKYARHVQYLLQLKEELYPKYQEIIEEQQAI